MTKRRLIISILAFLVYAALVWFGARFFIEGSTFYLVVFVLFALGLTVLIVYLLISRLTAQSRPQAAAAEKPAEGAAAPATVAGAGQDPEVRAFGGLMADANTRLAQSPKLASRRLSTTVTGLPLLLIAGEAGAGKTSTFLNAGLDPELLSGQVFRDRAPRLRTWTSS